MRLNDKTVIVLEGSCPSGEAETLLQLLLARPEATVDWEACDELHSAVLQVLLAAGIKPRGRPRDGFLRRHVAPLFGGVGAL